MLNNIVAVLSNVDSKTVFKLVFINLEKVVHFFELVYSKKLLGRAF